MDRLCDRFPKDNSPVCTCDGACACGVSGFAQAEGTTSQADGTSSEGESTSSEGGMFTSADNLGLPNLTGRYTVRLGDMLQDGVISLEPAGDGDIFPIDIEVENPCELKMFVEFATDGRVILEEKDLYALSHRCCSSNVQLVSLERDLADISGRFAALRASYDLDVGGLITQVCQLEGCVRGLKSELAQAQAAQAQAANSQSAVGVTQEEGHEDSPLLTAAERRPLNNGGMSPSMILIISLVVLLVIAFLIIAYLLISSYFHKS